MELIFTKMHGAGNDYIYFNCFDQVVDDPKSLAQLVSDRHTGIGGDGIVLIMPSDVANVRMRIFNADGSEAEMCGNAIRCVAKYVYEHGICVQESLSVETGSGVKTLDLTLSENTVHSVCVDMGEPVLSSADIPVQSDSTQVIDAEFDEVLRMTCVSMGNPHCVFFVDEITDDLVLERGPSIETDSRFPRKINVEFVKVIDRNNLEMRVWERGSGETLACGTGASAVTVAAVLNDLAEREVVVHLRGGDLTITWGEDNHVYMDGPAEEVFTGTITI